MKKNLLPIVIAAMLCTVVAVVAITQKTREKPETRATQEATAPQPAPDASLVVSAQKYLTKIEDIEHRRKALFHAQISDINSNYREAENTPPVVQREDGMMQFNPRPAMELEAAKKSVAQAQQVPSLLQQLLSEVSTLSVPDACSAFHQAYLQLLSEQHEAFRQLAAAARNVEEEPQKVQNDMRALQRNYQQYIPPLAVAANQKLIELCAGIGTQPSFRIE